MDIRLRRGDSCASTRIKNIAFVAAITFLCCTQALASAEGSFQRTLKVAGAVNLDINTGSGTIEVHTGNSNQVEVTGHIRASDWFGGGNAEERVRRIESNPPIQQSGNSIRIGHIDDPELRHNISISYEVTVPAETQLHSESGSGNQTISGIHGTLTVTAGSGGLKISDIGDTVRAETGSGNIDIDRVKGNVRARAGSGSIRGTGIAGGFEGGTGSGVITVEQTAPGAVRVDTGSGGMELRGIKGSLEAHAGSGAIRADGEPTGPWTLRTGSGGVHLKLVSNGGFDLDAQTSSGSLNVDQPLTGQGAIERKHIRGKVRGGGVPITVETGSGNISIQ